MIAVRATHPAQAALVCAALLLAVAACGGGGDDVVVARPAPRADTLLTIRVWPNGKAAGHVKRWTLTCSPDGGTLPDPRRACSRLDALDDPFAPVPQEVACTQMYGGPEVADVLGTYRAASVSATFSRTDGCQISRWADVSFLLETS